MIVATRAITIVPIIRMPVLGEKTKNQLIKYSPVFKKLQLLHVEHYLRVVLLFCRGACECLSAVLRAECGRDDS